MKLKWLGTASLLFEIEDKKILFDPFYSRNKNIKIDYSDFLNSDYIFITHPHFDHLCDVSKIVQNSNAVVYGTKTTINHLKTYQFNEKRLNLINYQDKITIGKISIIAHKSKHIKTNLGKIIKTMFDYRVFTKLKNFIWILKTHKKFPMNNEIVAYEIRYKNKNILIFGSGNIDNNIDYPKNVDLLIFAYQGRTNLASYTIKILKKLQPKNILLNHFDDTFPPITSQINPKRLYSLIKKENLNIGIKELNYENELEI